MMTLSPLNRTLGMLLGAVVLATLFYGGDFALAKPLVALAGGLAFLGAPAPRVGLSAWLRWGVILPMALLGVWSAVGLLPWGSASLWQETPAGALWPSFSIVPGQTLADLISALGWGAWAAAAWRVACQPQGSQLMVRGMAGLGALFSLYALIVYMMGNAVVFLSPKTAYPASLTGTFIYHNSYAAFTGLGMLALLAVMMERVGEISGQLSLARRLKAFFWLVFVPRWWIIPLWGMEMLTLVLSTSRGGLGTVAVGHAIFMGALAVGRRPLRFPLALVALLGIGLGGFLLEAQGGNLASRMGKLTTEVDGRTALYETTWSLIRQSPWIGTGLGTFPAVFPTARTPEVRGKTEHAHHLYLEIAAELGLPALGLAMGAGTVGLACLLEGVRTRRRAIVYPALGVAVFAQLALHSMVDFIVAIPAVALAGLILLGAALSQAEGVGKTDMSGKASPRQAPWLKGAAGGLCGLALWLTLTLWVAVPGDHVVQAFLSKSTPSAGAVQRAERSFNLCTRLNPLEVSCRAGYAQLLASEASYLSPATAEGRAALARAEKAYGAALGVNVSQPFLWWRLAQIHNLQGQPSTAATDMVKSVLFGPKEMPVARLRLPLLQSLIPFAKPEDKALLEDNARFVAASPRLW